MPSWQVEKDADVNEPCFHIVDTSSDEEVCIPPEEINLFMATMLGAMTPQQRETLLEGLQLTYGGHGMFEDLLPEAKHWRVLRVNPGETGV